MIFQIKNFFPSSRRVISHTMRTRLITNELGSHLNSITPHRSTLEPNSMAIRHRHTLGTVAGHMKGNACSDPETWPSSVGDDVAGEGWVCGSKYLHKSFGLVADRVGNVGPERRPSWASRFLISDCIQMVETCFKFVVEFARMSGSCGGKLRTCFDYLEQIWDLATLEGEFDQTTSLDSENIVVTH